MASSSLQVRPSHHVDAEADCHDRRVVAAIHSLLIDDDDDDRDVPPPPPPAYSSDDEDASGDAIDKSATDDGDAADDSARSSPDESYSSSSEAGASKAPVLTAAPAAAAAPTVELAAKHLIPFAASGFGALQNSDEADAMALEELEALSARNDDDDASYHGGATTDGDDDDERLSSSDGDSPQLAGRHHNLHDDDFELDGGEDAEPASSFHVAYEDPEGGAASFVDPNNAHPFLDLDAQRRQVEWDKSQLRAAYHNEMQRTVTLGNDERVAALRALVNEADRFHRRHLAPAGAALPLEGGPANPLTPAQWGDIGFGVECDLESSGPASVQRNLSCMCIFSLHTAAREYGDHEEERSRRQAGQHRTIQALRLQAMRGEPSRFLLPRSATPFPDMEL
uniref:Uncharacterized protein n=1 Tax=Neobodo designis TaxID=312471 RepID=A0A7S1Q2R8_NEODS|mmetsp:Transcript_30904/g.95431  ORF Transcript_30904/g.95431 Transcript_30904/m.95431 type:complete len:395 (+) Transcript_30904:499-1683(+)